MTALLSTAALWSRRRCEEDRAGLGKIFCGQAPPGGSGVVHPARTAEQIAPAMAKADRRVCLGSERCFALPYRLADARATCTPKGRCKVGWIVSRGGRESVDVWLEVRTGLVKLIRQADA
jgi:hypothetical protein